MTYHLALRSNNAKVGPIPVSTSSAKTCPDECPLKVRGCYARTGPLSWHWRKVTLSQRGDSWRDFVTMIKALPAGQLWRHNQAGDLPGEGSRINPTMMSALVEANHGKRGFTYTHKPLNRQNRAAIASANRNGFTVNLSADNLREADSLANAGIGPVVVTLPEGAGPCRTPEGRKVIICPAQTRDTTCAECKLCSVANRSVIVGFLAHGQEKSSVKG